MPISEIKKTYEVLYTENNIKIDGDLSDTAWGKTAFLDNYYYLQEQNQVNAEKSPFNVRIIYDVKNLYIAGISEFPTEPRADAKFEDVKRIFGDEPVEYFFSAENNNICFIQYALNSRGIFFNSVREYDKSGKIATKTDWKMEHEKGFTYKNSKWVTETVFPLNVLKIDLRDDRYCGFQIAQTYYKTRNEEKLRTLSWCKALFFPVPTTFGLLVFNKKPFGLGKMAIQNIFKNEKKEKTDFSFVLDIKDFPPGTYTVKQKLVDREGKIYRSTKEISVQNASERLNLEIKDAYNGNGLYTHYIQIQNKESSACVLGFNFQNQIQTGDLFGSRIFHPEVKQVKWGTNNFYAGQQDTLYVEDKATERTLKTAGIFIEKYYGYTGKKLLLKKSGNIEKEKGLVMVIRDNVMWSDKEEKLKPEGYHIKISTDRAVLAGKDEPGLFYAGITFIQALKNSMKIEKKNPVLCVEILDWPDITERPVLMHHPSLKEKFWKIKDKYTIQELMEYAEKYVINMKMNIFLLDASAAVNYEKNERLHNPDKPYTMNDMKILADFLRDNFVKPGFKWEVGGHGGYWLTGYCPELREKGWRDQSDVTHPDHNKIVFGAMEEIIDAMKPDFISPSSDEYWHFKKENETRDELLHGKTRAQAFLDFHLELRNFLKNKDKNIKMAIYYDMLDPTKHGERFDVYKVTDQMPKDIILMKQNDDDQFDLTKFGFKIWSMGVIGYNGYKDFKNKLSGSGAHAFMFGYRNTIDTGSVSFSRINKVLMQVNIAWNFLDDRIYDDTIFYENGKMPAIFQMLAVKKNPYASDKIQQIDIKVKLNYSFADFIREKKIDFYAGLADPLPVPEGVQDIGFIPMQLYGIKNKNCIIAEDGKPEIIIDIKGNFSALIFLHALEIGKDSNFKKAQSEATTYPFGLPAGNYIIKYADTTEEIINIRIDNNINRLYEDNIILRDALNCRYKYVITDSKGRETYLHQWEWVNPHPEKKILSVTLKHDNLINLDVLLFALSGREVNN
ncbi:MAG: hypothetical protein A2096_13705 [Spirochaetes bacterium GWF1_41_5]|nr:MAG: hypothetical protein A2096_13705 [Spirochaetes bacterium GWF1_41_5]HBE00936.1 hypothetical protein [Spirochaetia bacterium]